MIGTVRPPGCRDAQRTVRDAFRVLRRVLRRGPRRDAYDLLGDLAQHHHLVMLAEPLDAYPVHARRALAPVGGRPVASALGEAQAVLGGLLELAAVDQLAATMVARLAKGVMALDEEITELEALIEARFREHPHAEVIQSLPGMGTMLSAEFLAATGGDMDTFGTADRLAGYAGLAPVPRDSGRVSGNLHRPRRYHRGLLRAFYLSAFASLRNCPASKQFYERKRAEGKGHKQALLALARRRANVLWAMIRDGACYQATPPVTATA